MYTVSPEAAAVMQTDYLYLTSVFVIIGLLRYIQIAVVDEKSGQVTEVPVGRLDQRRGIVGIGKGKRVRSNVVGHRHNEQRKNGREDESPEEGKHG